MTIDEYIAKIKEFVVVPEEHMEAYLTTLLASEAGEVAGLWGKWLRGDFEQEGSGGAAAFDNKMLLELSDCAFALCLLADWNGFTLEQVFEANINKLEARKAKGTIRGSGERE